MVMRSMPLVAVSSLLNGLVISFKFGDSPAEVFQQILRLVIPIRMDGVHLSHDSLVTVI